MKSILGKVAIANGKQTYVSYQKLFSGDRWKALATKGAQTRAVDLGQPLAHLDRNGSRRHSAASLSHGALPDDELERHRSAAAQQPQIDRTADAVGAEQTHELAHTIDRDSFSGPELRGHSPRLE